MESLPPRVCKLFYPIWNRINLKVRSNISLSLTLGFSPENITLACFACLGELSSAQFLTVKTFQNFLFSLNTSGLFQ